MSNTTVQSARAELIDGVFYDMEAPSAVYQMILVQLAYQFVPCVEQHPKCELFIAPCDVRLNNDNKTMVQPGCGNTGSLIQKV